MCSNKNIFMYISKTKVERLQHVEEKVVQNGLDNMLQGHWNRRVAPVPYNFLYFYIHKKFEKTTPIVEKLFCFKKCWKTFVNQRMYRVT